MTHDIAEELARLVSPAGRMWTKKCRLYLHTLLAAHNNLNTAAVVHMKNQ